MLKLADYWEEVRIQEIVMSRKIDGWLALSVLDEVELSSQSGL